MDWKHGRPALEVQARYAACRPLRELRNRLLVNAFHTDDDVVVRTYIVALLYSDPEVRGDILDALGPEGHALAQRSFIERARIRARRLIDKAQ